MLSEFRLQSIIEHVSSNGIVLQNHGFEYDSCIRDYILSRQEDVYRVISKRIKPIKVNTGVINNKYVQISKYSSVVARNIISL